MFLEDCPGINAQKQRTQISGHDWLHCHVLLSLLTQPTGPCAGWWNQFGTPKKKKKSKVKDMYLIAHLQCRP